MQSERRLYPIALLFVVFLLAAVVRASDHGARAVDLVGTSGAAGGIGVVVGLIVARRQIGGGA
jgi:hypothetical protein